MICARCDKPIRQGEKHEDVDKFSASGGGASMVVHKGDCPGSIDFRRKEWRHSHGL